MSTEKKDGPRSRVQVFLELKVLKFVFSRRNDIPRDEKKRKKQKARQKSKVHVCTRKVGQRFHFPSQINAAASTPAGKRQVGPWGLLSYH